MKENKDCYSLLKLYFDIKNIQIQKHHPLKFTVEIIKDQREMEASYQKT